MGDGDTSQSCHRVQQECACGVSGTVPSGEDVALLVLVEGVIVLCDTHSPREPKECP